MNPAASDANPGTEDSPFKTISKAAAVAQAGDYVVVKAGTYAEEVAIAHSGVPDSPIVFEARGAVVIAPPSVINFHAGIGVRGLTDIVIRGFTIRDAYFGVAVESDRDGTPSERITIERNHTIMTESSGIRAFSSKGVSIVENQVEKSNHGGIHEMISIIGSDGFEVRGNEVWNGAWTMNGAPVEGKEGIDVKEGSANGRILGNHVHDLTRLGIYVDAYAKPTSNIEVSGNVVHGCKQGVAIASESGGELASVLVSNNILYGNLMYGITVANWVSDGPRRDITIVNNTVYGNAGGGIGITTTNVTGLTIRNNIVAGVGGGGKYHAADPGAISASEANLVWGGNPGNVTAGVTNADPRFVSPETGDFGLAVGSAAIDTGVTSAAVPTDARGTKRPQGAAYDIGAIERIEL